MEIDGNSWNSKEDNGNWWKLTEFLRRGLWKKFIGFFLEIAGKSWFVWQFLQPICMDIHVFFLQNNQNSFMKSTKCMETQEIYGKHQAHGKLWKFHGNLHKKFMENERYLKNLMEIHVFFLQVYGWKFMEMYRSSWKFKEAHGNWWKFMESHEKFMEIDGHSWKFQCKYGNPKKFMEVDGNSEKKWKFMDI